MGGLFLAIYPYSIWQRRILQTMPDLDLVHLARLPDELPRQLQSGLHWLDLIGIVAFAMSGSLMGVRKRFDLFGVLVLGCVTAVGGGAIRDTMTGQTPPLFLRDETYLYAALLGAITGFALGERMNSLRPVMNVVDTIGLALFATSGAVGAIQIGLGPLGVVFAGMMSGVGGGMIRDLIANEVPEVMYRRDNLYATAAAAGAASTWLADYILPVFWAQMLGACVVLILRWISEKGWVNLPVRRIPERH